MKTESVFSPSDRLLIGRLYRELRGKCDAPFEGERYRRLKRSIVEAIGDGRFHRDVFGLNPVVRSLQTALLVTDEIGLNEEAVEACILMPYYKSAPELQEVEQIYGAGVRRILSGLEHIEELYAKSPSIESENFRNLLISFAEDMRVILIMIADRTNLMRQIKDSDNADDRLRVSEEAAYLYAPLAHKLGLYQLKSELEDLSLKYMNHEAYYHIKDKLSATKEARDRYMEAFMKPVAEMLDKAHLKYRMKGRTKSIHSIWQKMKRQGCPFEGVYDLFAIRIILDAPLKEEKQQCWQVYSLITDMYRPNPKRLRDWLSIPKSNGYESLHITVLGPENKWVEVQIRTERMDEIAEHGLAAHWRYKGIKAEAKGIETWLANIRGALEEGDDMKLMDQFRSDLSTDEIYVFTPKGDLHKLPKGATVLDFAYDIHTDVGTHCTGGTIAGRQVSMRQQLQSGDQVSITTSQSQLPKLAWLDYVVTGRAKAKIRQSLKEQEVKETGLAKELISRKFRNRKVELDPNVLNQVIKKLGYKEVIYFYRDVLDEHIDLNHVIEQYQEQVRHNMGLSDHGPLHSADEFSMQSQVAEQAKADSADDELVIDSHLKGIDYSLAQCCHPIYGDDIFGFVTVNKGIKIHRKNCPNAAALRERFGYRIVKARWAGKGEGGFYPITLHIVGNDDLGVVNNISSIISKEEQINMRSFSIDAHDGLFSGMLTVMIRDTKMLDNLMKKLKTVKGVKNVSRG